MPIGYDVGTYNLVCCQRDSDGNFVHKREVNCFIDMPLEKDNRFVFNMMLQAGVPLIEKEDRAYALGEAAIDMAYTMPQIELKRPMSQGCVNPQEKDAFEIMKIMIHSLLDDIKKDGDILYYSIPANAINEETDADYHKKVLEAILNAYKSENGYGIKAYAINEALALVYAELASKAYTGIAISFGSGMVNICYAKFGKDMFTFSIVNSGDWIDKQAAKASGESVAVINKEKTKVKLNEEPSSLLERAIQTQYRIMIEKTVSCIKKGFEQAGNKARADHPVDVVVAGGTSSPEGFPELFQQVLLEAKLPVEIGKVIRPSDPLYSVARGCLIAAENAMQ